MDMGAIFSAQVCAFLPEDYDLEERVYLSVNREQ
jgi:hypothetical protein